MKFDNLTGDASLNWISSAAQQILIQELYGASRTLPLAAETDPDAYGARATSLVHGYFDQRGGKLHFEMAVEDAARHKTTQTAAVDGDPLPALSSLAKHVDPAAREFSTASSDAVAAWGQGAYERAVAIDPAFGAAWLTWAQSRVAAGDNTGALATASRALEVSGLKSPIDRAQIQVLEATLRPDAARRLAALRELASLLPADPTPSRALAESEMNARHFAEAARAYREVLRADSADGASLNLLGYAEAFAGNLEGARAAFEQYGRQPGQSTNALDSLGEGLFANGKFADAEKAFLQAFARDPSFLAGAPLWKAAHAHWLGGDLQGADGLAQRYFENLQKAHDPATLLRQANWLYETGRTGQAVALLRQAPPEAAAAAQQQLSIWSNPLPANPAELKKLYEATPPTQDGLVRTLYGSALLRAGNRDEARKLVVLWPLPERADSFYQALLYPRFMELRKALAAGAPAPL